ncbi:MAG TPA: discoidin domain-containing protein [Puia sp.]|uniref:discoidin domain-containing protein n=1 Tax=Puia sp. TaxID=2045100 RepID=UPI002C6AC1D3|nr:discoidin domain-containing protein [Puia sp.]HVU97119.1 discoidin domain-containing protein [Puia sp.]
MMRTIFLSIVVTLASITLYAQVDVLTQHNDNNRTGWNNQETTLNTSNVKPGLFGKLFDLPVDDQVYSQPLIVSGVTISGGTHNVAIVATVNNSVYAFDADNGTQYWMKNFTPAGNFRPPLNTDYAAATLCTPQYVDFTEKIGIIGTPVIDKNAGYIYFVSRDVTTSGAKTFTQRLHAISISTGIDRQTPTVITASIPGTGEGSSGGTLNFDPFSQNQRPGLLLLNGVVYIGYSSHCDMDPYHGWLLGYNAADLTRKYVYCSTANGEGGGIWQSGNGIAADDAGNIFVATGNGTTDATANSVNLAASMIKLTPSGNQLDVTDFFTPSNYAQLDQGDLDFGPCETLIIPGLNRILTGAKDGNLYLLDQNNLGKYTGGANYVQNIYQKDAHLRCSFGYYKGTANEYVYTWPENTALRAWSVNRTTSGFSNTNPNSVPTSGIPGPQGNNGANLSTSSNGNTDNTAILWATHAYNGCDANHQTCPGVVRAINANDVTKELWNSVTVPGDDIGNYAKMSSPTVANGKLYVASFSGHVTVYGLLGNGVDTCTSSNIALKKPATASSFQYSSLEPDSAFDGKLSTRWGSAYSDNQWIYVDLGKSYDLCKVIIRWEAALGKDFDIQVSNDKSTWKTVYSVRGNTQFDNTMPLQGSGRYVKMLGITRGTGNGYSILEMEVYGTPTVTCFPPTNLSASNVQQNMATLNWDGASGAALYDVQYKATTAATWQTTSTANTSISITGLSCATDYLYRVVTHCTDGTHSDTTSAGFSTLDCSGVCGPLPTRWTTADIGTVGVGGEACYDGTTFSLQGSGADIGGTADAFRYAFFSLSDGDELVGRVATLDNTTGDKAGIMIRQATNSPGDPNAFIALSAGTGAIFQTRSTQDGPTTTATVSGIVPPYWVRLVKSGSSYSGFISSNGLTWTQVGATQDLGFGSGSTTVNGGLAISSGNNTSTATVTIDNFMKGSNLPIELSNFTGRSTGQEIVLQWTTAMEQNVGYFEVQRSADGSHFTVIGTVTAVGNSNSPQDYTYTDGQPSRGVNYYRLRETDRDGKATYSPVIAVRSGNQTAPLIFPNPASSYFRVVPGTEPIREVSVYDISGRRMFNQLNGNAAGTLDVAISRLSQGVYFVEVRTDKGRSVQKLIKR